MPDSGVTGKALGRFRLPVLAFRAEQPRSKIARTLLRDADAGEHCRQCLSGAAVNLTGIPEELNHLAGAGHIPGGHWHQPNGRPAMTTVPRQHGHDPRQPASAQTPLVPLCRNCLTDAHLEITGYVPATYALDRDHMLPPVVSYSCKHCGKHYAHPVPGDWRPAGWEWYD